MSKRRNSIGDAIHDLYKCLHQSSKVSSEIAGLKRSSQATPSVSEIDKMQNKSESMVNQLNKAFQSALRLESELDRHRKINGDK